MSEADQYKAISERKLEGNYTLDVMYHSGIYTAMFETEEQALEQQSLLINAIEQYNTAKFNYKDTSFKTFHRIETAFGPAYVKLEGVIHAAVNDIKVWEQLSQNLDDMLNRREAAKKLAQGKL